MNPRIYHYSEKPIYRLMQKRHYDWDRVPWEEMALDKKNCKSPGKPMGLWISAGNSWYRWCKDEKFFDYRLRYQYQINLKKDHNILMLTDLENFDKFCHEYGFDPYNVYGPISEKTKAIMGDITPDVDFRSKFLRQWDERKFYPDVRWNLVKEKYQGIIICPYFHQRRLMTSHSQWYYGWDCASGCIWDISCIKSFKLFKKHRVKREPPTDYELASKEGISDLLLGAIK